MKDLREPGTQLRIGLKLDVGNKLRPQWEEIYAYQLTALYGLEVTALNDHHGLTFEIQNLLRELFIPALLVAGILKYDWSKAVRRDDKPMML